MKKEIWQGDFGGDQNSSPKAPPRRRKGLERRKKKRYQKRSVCRRNDKKSRKVRVIEKKEVKEDDLIKHFFPTRLGITSSVLQRLITVKVFQNEQSSGGRKCRERKKSNLLSAEKK